MQTYNLSNVARQIDKIREEMLFSGFFVAGSEDLDFLGAGRASEAERATWLKQISDWEGWVVEKRRAGKVRFSLSVNVNGSFVSHQEAA